MCIWPGLVCIVAGANVWPVRGGRVCKPVAPVAGGVLTGGRWPTPQRWGWWVYHPVALGWRWWAGGAVWPMGWRWGWPVASVGAGAVPVGAPRMHAAYRRSKR